MITPIRALVAALVAFAGIIYLLKTGLLPRPVTFAIGVTLWALFRWWNIRNSKASREQHQRDIEDLKHKPVLHLDDDHK
jgi:hypothetical protein